jgi:hypothetical protein
VIRALDQRDLPLAERRTFQFQLVLATRQRALRRIHGRRRRRRHYPSPIVDHGERRIAAITGYELARQGSI